MFPYKLNSELVQCCDFFHVARAKKQRAKTPRSQTHINYLWALCALCWCYILLIASKNISNILQSSTFGRFIDTALSATLNLIPLMSNTQKDTQILTHIERRSIQQRDWDPAGSWYILPSVMCAQYHHCWMILNKGKLWGCYYWA